MQSKTTRGVRHLLVSTGVISLVLSVAAPAALADAESKGNDKEKDKKGTEVDEPDTAEETVTDRKVWVCHPTSSVENPWELNLVSVAAEGPAGELVFPDQAAVAAFQNKNDLLAALEAGEVGATTLATLITTGCEDVSGGGEGTDAGSGGNTDGSNAGGNTDGSGNAGGNTDGSSNAGGNTDGGNAGGNTDGGNAGGNTDGGNAGGNTDGSSNAGGNTDGSNAGGSGDNGVGKGAGGGKTGNNGVGQGGENPGQGQGGGVIVDTPTETIEPGTGNPVVVEVPVTNAPITPATPADPIPAAQPRPVVNISTDTVTKPVVPATPASPAAAPEVQQNEVLGAVTTRTPTPGVGALDPGTHTAASITALAATGADGTKVLAVAGVILLLSGFGLQVSGRRRMRSAMVEA